MVLVAICVCADPASEALGVLLGDIASQQCHLASITLRLRLNDINTCLVTAVARRVALSPLGEGSDTIDWIVCGHSDTGLLVAGSSVGPSIGLRARSPAVLGLDGDSVVAYFHAPTAGNGTWPPGSPVAYTVNGHKIFACSAGSVQLLAMCFAIQLLAMPTRKVEVRPAHMWPTNWW